MRVFDVLLPSTVSLYQVLNALGVVFTIPYPPLYEQAMSQISTIELDLPSLLPLNCIFRRNFAFSLVSMTLGPLIVIIMFEVLSNRLLKKHGEAAKRAKAEGKEEPVGAFMGGILSDLSFFLLFLLYPGCCTKIFNALFCVGFDDPSEDGQRFLRVDFSIDCNSTLYGNPARIF